MAWRAVHAAILRLKAAPCQAAQVCVVVDAYRSRMRVSASSRRAVWIAGAVSGPRELISP